jgi:hypothetical protein
MRVLSPLVYFYVIAMVAIGVSCWGTVVLFRQPNVPRLQRFGQFALIWTLPVLGALLVAEMYGALRRRQLSTLNADGINPLLNQALQPLARGETRAALDILGQEAANAAVHHLGADFTSSGDAQQ